MRKKRKAKEGEGTKRVKRPRATEAQRAVARTLAKEGYIQLEAAKRTKMSQASVSRFGVVFELQTYLGVLQGKSISHNCSPTTSIRFCQKTQ